MTPAEALARANETRAMREMVRNALIAAGALKYSGLAFRLAEMMVELDKLEAKQTARFAQGV